MDHIGIDVHKKESQVCILGEDGELSERRIRTTPERFAAVLGERPRARILLEASTGERVGGAVSGRAGPRGDRGRPELRADVRRPAAEDQDGSARRAGAGRGLSAGAYRPAASALRRPASCARAPDGARRPGAHPHRLHRRDPRPAPAARLARADRQCRGLHPPRPRAGAARPPAVGARPPARRDAPGQSAARVLGRADRGRRAAGRTRRSGCRPCRASGRSRPPPSWPRSTMPGASHGPIRSRPTWAWCPASGARGRANGAGGSPRPAIGACVGCWSRPRCRSGACGIPPPPPSGSGPSASPHAGAGSSPSSRWPGAWPGSSTRCSATAPGIDPHEPGSRRARAPWRRSPSSPHDGEVLGLAGFDGWVSA